MVSVKCLKVNKKLDCILKLDTNIRIKCIVYTYIFNIFYIVYYHVPLHAQINHCGCNTTKLSMYECFPS